MDKSLKELQGAIRELRSEIQELRTVVADLKALASPAPAGKVDVTGRLKLAAILGIDVGEIEVNIANFDSWVSSALESVLRVFFPRTVIRIDVRDDLYCYPDGYLKREGVRFLVDEFLKARGSNERFVDAFVLFDPPGQQCWLVGTQHLILYILENESDRFSSEQNIEWILPKEDRDPIEVRARENKVDIGPMKGWKYSPKHFKNNVEILRKKIEEL